MTDEDKRALAEEFIRGAATDLGADVVEEEIVRAVERAAKALPPYS